MPSGVGCGTLPAMGIEFRETMAGSYHLLASPRDERPLAFTIQAVSRRLSSFVRVPLTEVEGEMHAEGFADHKALRGTLALDLLRNGSLPYNLSFSGNDGRAYRFQGTKVVSLRRLVQTMTELPAALLDEQGVEVGRALVRFDMQRDLARFLRSWRLVG